MRTVLARDLQPGMLVDLEPAFIAFGDDDDKIGLRDRVHWSIYELASVEKVSEDTPGVAWIYHDNGVMTVPVDYELTVEDDTAFSEE